MRRPTIAVLGMMSRMPVAGVVWQTVHYLLGFRRLGYDVVYVEAHARTPSMLMESEDDDGGLLAAAFIERVLRRHGLADRWAFAALHDDGAQYGLGRAELERALREADIVLNLHGGTEPRSEHFATGRLVYLETDPVQLQVELHEGNPDTIAFLEPHCAFFTFGENIGAPDCGVPVTTRFRFLPTRQPVVLDLWPQLDGTPRRSFTTIANWNQPWRDVVLDGELYRWSKHLEFEPLLDLPARTGASFELALSGCDEPERQRLVSRGWAVSDGLSLSRDDDDYRAFIQGSLAELTAAKDQNVRLRSGWFSDRSATYLACGRPVITQDTGFGANLPVGRGLHAFASCDEAAEAVEQVTRDYDAERRTAHEIARECFDAERVLARLLVEVGLPARGVPAFALPPQTELTPVSRRPLVLPATTQRVALDRPVPFPAPIAGRPRASIVVVTHNGLAFTRLCLESVLAHTENPYELVVVDNGSCDGTRSYLLTLARRATHIRLLTNTDNRGFPAASNQGIEQAQAATIVLLNNDCIVTPGWLGELVAPLADPSVGIVGPTTNRIGNEAEISVEYGTVAGMLELAGGIRAEKAGVTSPLPTPAMFCAAFTRATAELLGPLDEGFGIGTLEDDDYAMRARAAGLRNLCAEGAFVHHFGEASFGKLVASGDYARLLERNRERYAERWGVEWSAYGRRRDRAYESLREHVQAVVETVVPEGAEAAVVSRGDDELIRFARRRGTHFPRDPAGCYAGSYPATSAEAVAHLEELRRAGARYFVVPRPGFWWLEHYAELRDRLEDGAPEIHRDDACVIFELTGALS